MTWDFWFSFNFEWSSDLLLFASSCSYISSTAFSRCNNLVTFEVSDENPYFASSNNTVMDKNKTYYVFIPQGITKLFIPSTVRKISQTLLQTQTKLTEILLESNDIWNTEQGILYSNDFTVLVAVCGGISRVIANDNVLKIDSYAANGCSLLEYFSFGKSECIIMCSYCFARTQLSSISIPTSVQFIEEYAFWSSNNLHTISFSPKSKLSKISPFCFYETA